MVIEKYVSRFQPLSIPSLVPLIFTWCEHDTDFFSNELTWSILMMETFVILDKHGTIGEHMDVMK